MPIAARPAPGGLQEKTRIDSTTTQRATALEYLPVGLFGSVMGLTGLSVAWQLAHERFGVARVFSEVIGDTSVVVFLLLAAGYFVKIATAPHTVRAEFAHPIAVNLFGTVFISLLLLPIVLARFNLSLAQTVWAVGAIGMTAFAWYMVYRWITYRQQIVHATPAWIIPVVGMLDVPLAMPALGLQTMHGVMVFGLAVGFFFMLPLFTVIFSRLVFGDPIPDALQPSLLILLAPCAVGTSAYIATTGQVDLFAESLFGVTLFMLAVLLGRLRYLPVCCPFRVSWWAVSFPLAAAAIASLRIASAVPGPAVGTIAIALLALATIVIVALMVRTLLGIARGELRTISG